MSIRKGPGQVLMGPQQPRPKLQRNIPKPPARAVRADPAREGAGEMSIHPIEEGTLVRVTCDVDGFRKGFQFVIDEYVEPRPVAEREHEDEIDAPIYYGNANGGSGNVCVPADAVEVVKTAAEMDARVIPTRQEIRDGLASEIVGYLGYDGAEIEETIHSGDHDIEVYGRTDDGLGFGFTVRVLSVWETDL